MPTLKVRHASRKKIHLCRLARMLAETRACNREREAHEQRPKNLVPVVQRVPSIFCPSD